MRNKTGRDALDGERVANLVEGDDEGTLLLLQQVDGLECLRLQAVHDVHHQDRDVAQRAASVPQVTGEKKRGDMNYFTNCTNGNFLGSVAFGVYVLFFHLFNILHFQFAYF